MSGRLDWDTVAYQRKTNTHGCSPKKVERRKGAREGTTRHTREKELKKKEDEEECASERHFS